jgi:hypothetical protein
MRAMSYLRSRRRTSVGLLAIVALVVVAVFVVLPSLATATPNWQAPPSSTYNITPELLANGGQNNDCSFFYGTTANADGTVTIPNGDGTPTIPAGTVLHQFYLNNPKNPTNKVKDPSTGVTFTVTVDTKTNVVTSVTTSPATAIVDIGIKGGVNTTHYNYSGFIPQPAGYVGPYPGTVTGDANLHPPVNGTGYYTVSHMSFCYVVAPLGATASGTVFTDVNHNGSYQSGTDTPLVATVNLYKSGVLQASMPSTGGAFQFTGLTPGLTTYKVCVVQPASTVETLPISSTANKTACSGGPPAEASLGYSVNSTTSVTGLDFGFAQQATIGGHVYGDPNGDGTGTTPLPGVAVRLYKGDGTTLLGNTTTDANGSYSFSSQYVGDAYTVCATSPGASYVQTRPTPGVSCTNEGTNGIPIPQLGLAGSSSNDFRFEQEGSLSGTVYQDNGGPGPLQGGAETAPPDGVRELPTDTISGTDAPLTGWTVKLYNGTTKVGQAASDVNGQYSITGIAFQAGQTYTACVTPASPPPPAWAQTQPHPQDPNSCVGLSGLQKGQQFKPATGSDTVMEDFGVAPSVSDPCSPPAPFGADLTGGELQIQLAKCKPSQTFVFNSGVEADGKPWASVFAADQVMDPVTNPEVPLIEKWDFVDPLNPDGTPKYHHIDFTDVFPYDPTKAVELPMCKLDPRDPTDQNGMTLLPTYQDDSNKEQVLPQPQDGSTPTSCAIQTRIYIADDGTTHLEVYAFSTIDTYGRMG